MKTTVKLLTVGSIDSEGYYFTEEVCKNVMEALKEKGTKVWREGNILFAEYNLDEKIAKIIKDVINPPLQVSMGVKNG